MVSSIIGFLVIVLFALSTCFVWILTKNESIHQTMLIIATITSFSSIFAVLLSLFIRAKLHEILGATAA